MQTEIKTLSKLINSNSFSKKDLEELNNLFKNLSSSEIHKLIEIFKENPEMIKIFIENYRLKKACGSSSVKWEKMIKEEEIFLKKLSNE